MNYDPATCEHENLARAHRGNGHYCSACDDVDGCDACACDGAENEVRRLTLEVVALRARVAELEAAKDEPPYVDLPYFFASDADEKAQP